MSDYLLKVEQEFMRVLARRDDSETRAFFRRKLQQSFKNGMHYGQKNGTQKSKA